MTPTELSLLANEIRLMADVVSPEHRRMFATAVREAINAAPRGRMSSSEFQAFLARCGLESKTLKHPVSL